MAGCLWNASGMVREKLKEELDVCVRRSLIAKALLEVCVVWKAFDPA